MINACLVGKEFVGDTKKGEQEHQGLLSVLATNKCGEERKCVGVVDVKSAF